MNFTQNHYIVYVKTNDNGYIVAVDSSAFLTDTTGWVEIDSGYGDKFHHAQNNYLSQKIRTNGGAYRYKLVDGKTVVCTAEEIAEQEDAKKPNPEISEADPTYEERIAALEKENATLKEENALQAARVNALSDQMDFYEECIVEMAEVVYA